MPAPAKSKRFTGLKTLFINCSIKKNKKESHTQRLMNRAAGIMKQEGVSVEHLYALQHIGYTIPPQADAGWLGAVGPGPSYGDTEWNGKKLDFPAGYDSEFTNRNTTFMAWNLMHLAKILKKNKGLPAKGNVAEDWRHVTNAEDVNPEYR